MGNGNKKYLEQCLEYRDQLVDSWNMMSDEYDKLVVALSGGALGLSFFFISDVITKKVSQAEWLVTAWALWTSSLICVGAAFLASQKSLEKAIRQVDYAISEDDSSLLPEMPGGLYTKITNILNYSAGIFFVLGVATISVFVLLNMR